MDENQKYGVVTMVVSFLLMLLALMLSEGWSQQMGFLENLMYVMRIQLFSYETGEVSYGANLEEYHIDISTKYVELILLSTFAYGFTTYLGITQAYAPWKKING